MTTPTPPPAPRKPTPAAEPGGKRPRIRGRKRRIARWCVRVIIGVPLILIALSLILANSPIVGSMVRKELASASGCRVEMASAKIDYDGRIEIRKLRLVVPGLKGPEAELLYAEKAEIDLSWSAALSWSGLSAVKPTSIRLTDPVFRLSQSLDDGALNIGAIAAGGSGARGGVPIIPTVDVKDGRIEFAEHSEKRGLFETLNTIHVAGAFSSDPDGSYQIRMQEIGRLPPPQLEGEPQVARGMILDGKIDLQRAEAEIRLLNVPLEAWPPESVPTPFRETWRRLRIQGRIRETMFTYDRAGGVRVVVWPENVAMDIPVPSESTAARDDLSLRGVKGHIAFAPEGLSAELEGLFDDQTSPVHVRFKTEGTGMDAPLVCEIWGDGLTLARNPGFLPYIPPTAREFFKFFSGPTGVVDASVTLERGPPVDGVAAAVEVTDGRVTVRNGTAAFHKFPYPIHNMEVRAKFDEHHMDLFDIRGDGPTGAKLTAHAYAAPMTDDAEVHVSVHVSEVPVDKHLRAAMPGTRKQLLEVLFNEERYEQLVARGLIRPGAAGAGAAPGGPPAFTLGGMAEIDVTVVRPLGAEVDWQTVVVVRMPEAGVVPKPFPFPILARDVEIRIGDDDGQLTRGTFTGLRGGRAELSAHVQLTEAGQNVLKPRVDIAAFDVPVDDLLINAVPDDGAADPEAVSAKAILRRLEINGNVDCTAAIRDGDGGPEDIDYDVSVALKDIDARPRLTGGGLEWESRLMVSGATGRIRVTPRAVRVEELAGRLVKEDRGELPASPGETVASCGVFTVGLDAQIVEPGPAPEVGPPAPDPLGALTATVEAQDLDLAAPLPSLLGVFSTEVAGVLARMRDNRDPSGRLDASVRLERRAGGARPDVRASFSRLRGVSVKMLDSRMSLMDATGTVTYLDREDPDPRRRSSVRFEDFAAGLEYAGVPSGSINLEGGFSIDPEALPDTPVEQSIADAGLSVRVLDGCFETPLMSDLLARGLSAATVEEWKALDVEGVFDAQLDITGDPVVIAGLIGPREVSFQRAGKRAELHGMVGHVTFRTSPGTHAGDRQIEGRIAELGCEGEAWRAEVRGPWSFRPGEGLVLDTRVSVEGQSLSDELLALMPRDAIDGIEAVGLRVDGGFSMPEASLKATIADDSGGEGGDDVSVRFEGKARFAGASADVGVPLNDCDGEVTISVAARTAQPTEVAIELESERLSLLGLAMSGAHALLVSVPVEEGGGLALPFFTADCHGGRIWGNVGVGPQSADRPGREFTADLIAAGVLFAPLLDELAVPKQGVEGAASTDRPEPESPHEPALRTLDRTRGQADLRVSVSGRTGDPASRLGRGSIRVANGDVFRLPLVFSLVQMSNLILPSNDSFRYLQAEFHLRGQTAVFENIAVLSDSISLMGDGTATLPDMRLDLRFNSRSNKRIPIFSDVFEAVRDEIVTTRVGGTVGAPEIRSETFSTTRGILDAIIDPGREQAGSIGSDSSARREQDRVRRTLRPDLPLPPTTMPSRPTGIEG